LGQKLNGIGQVLHSIHSSTGICDPKVNQRININLNRVFGDDALLPEINHLRARNKPLWSGITTTAKRVAYVLAHINAIRLVASNCCGAIV
jgi:hypothetical protein